MGRSFRIILENIWDFIGLFLISLAIVIPIRLFIVQPFLVRGESMSPTFENLDYLFVERVSYYAREPKRAEVIVFRYPRDEREYYIKRIIGLPGEKIEIKGGNVFIKTQDGKDVVLKESYLPFNVLTAGDSEVRLGRNEYYVLGDNRGASSDSRSWGILPAKDIVGKVWVRLWPLNKVQAFWNGENEIINELP